MKDFFTGQMDYVFLVYGLAFILLAAVCVVLSKAARADFPWGWLGTFRITQQNSTAGKVVTISLGVSVGFPYEDSSPAELVAASDQALYRAKLAGRNRVEVSDLTPRGSR